MRCCFVWNGSGSGKGRWVPLGREREGIACRDCNIGRPGMREANSDCRRIASAIEAEQPCLRCVPSTVWSPVGTGTSGFTHIVLASVSILSLK